MREYRVYRRIGGGAVAIEEFEVEIGVNGRARARVDFVVDCRTSGDVAEDELGEFSAYRTRDVRVDLVGDRGEDGEGEYIVFRLGAVAGAGRLLARVTDGVEVFRAGGAVEEDETDSDVMCESCMVDVRGQGEAWEERIGEIEEHQRPRVIR